MPAERSEPMASLPKDKAWFTPPELARYWGVSPDKIRNWIRSGELEAVNQVARQGGRPRYRISREAVEKFEARRSVQVVPARPRRRPKKSDDVIEYF